MKVLLINPPILKFQNEKIVPVIENLFYNSVSLGLCYLAAFLRREGIEVSIIDASVEKLGVNTILNRILEISPDIIGLTSHTFSFPSALFLTRQIKENITDIITILGGAHVTAVPSVISKYKCFDIGVIGEGENTLLELVRNECKNLEKVKGIVYSNDFGLEFTGSREFIKDLDSLPFPARDLVPIEKYTPQPNDERETPKLSMITSRGCPYGCIFCDKSVFGYEHRSFSAEYIVDEMQHLKNEYNAKDIAFVDSTFFVNKEKIKKVVKEIKRRNLEISWTCSIRINLITKSILRQMKEAGCWRVRLGIESGNSKVLDFINKGITKNEVSKAARWANEIGLQPKGFFMIGHLIDNEKTINESISFAKSLPLKDITVQVNTPMKNTEQYEIYEKYGKLISNNLSDYSYWQPVFVPNELSQVKMMELHRKFYREFYLQPIIIWRHLITIRKLSDIRKYIRALRLIINLFFQKV